MLIYHVERILLSLILAFFIQLSNAQQHEWAQSFRVAPNVSGSFFSASALTTDDQGNIYIAGGFKDSIFIASDTHYFRATGTDRAIFLAKFDVNGSLLWSKSITTAKRASIKDMVINSDDELILFGSYTTSSQNPSISFGSYTLSANRGIFLAFLDSSGNFTNARNIGSATIFIDAIGIDLGPNDEIYTYLYFNSFGRNYTIHSSSGNVTGTGFAYEICKFNKAGNTLLWNNSYDINEHREIGSIAVEPNGDLIYAFRAGASQTLHGLSTGSETPIVLLRARSSNGNVSKIVKTNSLVQGRIQKMVVPRKGTIYIQGSSRADSVVIGGKVSKSLNSIANRAYHFTGQFTDLDSAVWLNSSTSGDLVTSQGSFMVYSEGFLYSGFAVEGDSMRIGGLTLKQKGTADVASVVAKFDSLGNCLWMLETVTNLPPFINPLPKGEVTYYGGFRDTLVLSPFTLAKPGNNTWLFLAKTLDFEIERGEVFAGPYCAGDSIIVPYTKKGSFDTSNVFIAEISNESGVFDGTERELGRIKTAKDSVIIGKLPLLKVASSNKYRIRVRSTSPTVQSFFRQDTLNLLVYSRDKADPGNDTSICIGDSIQLETFGGTTWNWSPTGNMDDSSSRTPIVWPDVNSTYQIIIGDSSGCGAPDTSTIEVSVLDPPRIDTSLLSDTSVCKNQTITASAIFSGGISTYFAIWQDSNGDIIDIIRTDSFVAKNFIIDRDSQFLLVLTDSCSAILDTAYFSVNVRKDNIVPPSTRDTSLCFREELIIDWDPFYSPLDSITISWKAQENEFSSTEFQWSKSFINSTSVFYEIQNKCTDSLFSDSFSISVFDSAEVQIGNHHSSFQICSSDTLRLSALPKGGNGNRYYQWSIEDSLLSTDSLLVIDLLNFDLIDQQIFDSLEIRLSYTDSCSVLVASDTLLIHTLPLLEIENTFTLDTSFCQGDTLAFSVNTLGGKGHKSFKWKINNQTTSTDSIWSFIPSQVGSGFHRIGLEVNDVCGHPDSIVKEVLVRDSLKVELLKDHNNKVCPNQELNFTFIPEGGDSSTYKVKWFIDSNLFSEEDALNYRFTKSDLLSPQTKTISVLLADQCSRYQAQDEVRIEILNQIVLSVEDDSNATSQSLDSTICFGNIITFTPEAYNSLQNRYSITWFEGDQVLSFNKSLIFNSKQYTPDTTYTITAVGFDSCSQLYDTLTINLKIRDTISLQTLNDTTLCYGSEYTNSANAVGGLTSGYQYQWTNTLNNSDISTSKSLTLRNLKTDTKLILKVFDLCSSDTAVEEINISVLPPLSLSLKEYERCFRDSIKIDVNPSGGILADYDYSWIINGELRSTDQSSITIYGDSSYTFNVFLNDGCSNTSDTIVGLVSSKPKLSYIGLKDTVCEYYHHSLNPMDSSALPSMLSLYQNENLLTSSNLKLAAGRYNYLLTAENSYNCKDTVSFKTFVKPLPMVDFTVTPKQPTDDSSEVKLEYTGRNYDSLFWNLNEQLLGKTNEIRFNFKDTGNYKIKLSVYHQGCTNDSSTIVTYSRNFRYLDVSAFSPNADGLNDTYKPIVLGSTFIQFKIFNRWGGLIFESSDETSTWDGNFNNQPAPQGTYVVLISAVDTKGRRLNISETVTLVR